MEGLASVRRDSSVGCEPTEAIGLRIIVWYKLVKAGAEVLLGVLLLSVGSAGVAGDLRDVARAIRHHAAAAWSLALADRFLQAATARSVLIVAWASLCDGLFSAFEGWALHRRFVWSRWLIVAATSFMVPFEVVALARHPRVGRAGLLVVNAAIAVYIARRRFRSDARPAGGEAVHERPRSHGTGDGQQ